jgi:hypothetical protein
MSLIAALLLAGAQPRLVKVGDCGWVHGRFNVTNGSRIHRIWMIGTGHVLSLDFPDEGEGSAADPFRRLYDRFTPFKDEIFGDFYVCARGLRIQGHMQSVHVKRMKNLRIVRR